MSEPGIEELRRLLDLERAARRAAELRAEASAEQLAIARRKLERLSSSLDAVVEERTQDLVRARDAAVRTSREQASSLAMMSHEVRTPMHTILGLAENLLDAELPSTEHDVVRRVLENATRLASLIDDFLDLARIGSGRATVENVAFDPGDLIESAVSVVAPQADRKHLELSCDVAPDTAPRVLGDPRKIAQIALNLVSNAVKYTSRGEVRVVARVVAAEGAAPDAGIFEVSVYDTGLGIAASDHERVFEPFVRVGNPSAEAGTGLGLALVRSLLHQLEGSIRIVSEPDRGSAFHVRIPVTIIEPHDARLDTRLVGLRTLLVGRSPGRRAALLQHLVHAGASVLETASWSMARGTHAVSTLDLVLIDPSSADLAMLAADRVTGPWATVPLVWIAPAAKADAATVRSLGASAVVESPVRRGRLFAAVARAMGTGKNESDAPKAARDAARPPRPPRLRALLVEDDGDNRHLLRRILVGLGYLTDSVPDGRIGLERATSFVYDVIVTDVAMPHMSGIEMIFALRAEEARSGLGRTPVLVVTASAFEATRLECERAGCDAFLAKPTRSAALAEALDRIVDARPAALVVDDSPDARHVARRFLEKDGTHRVVEAASGARAVEIVATERIDVVLLDLQMPGMDGMATLTALRQMILAGSTPIVAVTGHDDPETRRHCIALGFDDLLVKPFSREQLRSVLELHSRVAPETLGVHAAAPTKAAPSGAAAIEPGPRDVILVDPDIADLVPDFLESRRADVVRMRAAAEAREFAAVAKLAHMAKGTGGGYGFPEITRLGGDLERAARDQDALGVAAALAALENYLARVRYRATP